ncbi:MAG: ribosome silencing factor [candidate division Zixibacteria bacterium]|nr:ribosome silencing factor [candidate division Zixibacteria bacterium]
MTPKRLAYLAGKLALDKKATDVKILDLRKLSTICDFFVICSASVEVHAKAIADSIIENLEKKGIRAWHHEGYQASRWILLDYVDVVVHIFLNEVREFYELEKLWGDAKTEELSEVKATALVKRTGASKTKKRLQS